MLSQLTSICIYGYLNEVARDRIPANAVNRRWLSNHLRRRPLSRLENEEKWSNYESQDQIKEHQSEVLSASITKLFGGRRGSRLFVCRRRRALRPGPAAHRKRLPNTGPNSSPF